MHIQTRLCQSGAWSRREAKRLLLSGRVRINGSIAEGKEDVLQEDTVEVDGLPLPFTPEKRYYAYYKPRGIICTMQRSIEHNLADALPFTERIFPIGRLDQESEGLLLLTNDGSIVNPLMKKEFGKEKEYVVTTDRPLADFMLDGMRRGGIEIKGSKTLPCTVQPLSDDTFSIILTQGLNRQIRRMCRTFGYTVQRLKRVRIAHIHLGTLQPGEWRELGPEEIVLLKKTQHAE